MIRFVVALASEAQPVVEHFGLTPREGSFRWFQSDVASLVVSGVGKTAAAAASAYLNAKTGEETDAVWLNVGIAGHRDRAPGELVLAHTIADGESGDCFYPTHLGLAHLDTARVRTVTSAETEFLTEDFYDMEAYGFCETALRFSTAELVQCVKIVSDNRETGTELLTKERVSKLVANQLETIDEATKHLLVLASELEPLRSRPDELDPFLSTWRFSTTQARALKRLVGRCRALDPEGVPAPASLQNHRTAADVLQELENRIRTLALAQRGY